jgi:phage repressor protein C with HTH and peptisase S24 domain
MEPDYRETVNSVNRISVLSPWQPDGMDDTNKRLRQARQKAGHKSARAAALRYNWVPSTYASHENGQTPLPKEAALVYAKAFKVPPSWLLGIEGSINQPQKKDQEKNNLSANRLGDVPLFELDEPATVPEIDVTAGAAYAGRFSEEENTIDNNGNSVSRDVVRANWGIPQPFLTTELRIRPGRAHILSVRGDSMTDALYDGDRAIINLDDRDVSQGGIFALLDDNASVIIKQVELVRGSKSPRRIRCTSRNPIYTPFELDLDDPVTIIGRVASKITRL